MLQRAEGGVCTPGNEAQLKLGVLLQVFSEMGFIHHV